MALIIPRVLGLSVDYTHFCLLLSHPITNDWAVETNFFELLEAKIHSACSDYELTVAENRV